MPDRKTDALALFERARRVVIARLKAKGKLHRYLPTMINELAKLELKEMQPKPETVAKRFLKRKGRIK